MPWTGLCFLVGAIAISGLPPLNGFASEWLTFQAFLFGFRGSTEPLIHLLFSTGGALLALTTALAAACFVKAFGITFLALPRSRAAADARESPALMLVPQAALAVMCLGLGIFPGACSGHAGPGRSVVAGILDRALPVWRQPRVGIGARVLRSRRAGDVRRGPPGWRRRGTAAHVAPGCSDTPRSHVGMRRRADREHRVHGDGILEAPDVDLRSPLSPESPGRHPDRGLAVLHAGGALPLGDRADVRAAHVRAAPPGHSASGRRA